MSLEKQIKHIESEEHLKKTALVRSINMDYVDIISKSTEPYNERLGEILEEMKIIMKNPMTLELENRLDYLEKQYSDIEKLIKANQHSKIEVKDSSSLN
ncbi:MAG: hypothetical protein AAB477_02695 [Patescibacteria group bacterium]